MRTDINEEIEAFQNDFCIWILRNKQKAINIMAREENVEETSSLRYIHDKTSKIRAENTKVETSRYQRQSFEVLYNLHLCSSRPTPNWVS